MSFNWEPGETITLFNGQKFKRLDRNEAGGYFGTLFDVVHTASSVRMKVKRASNNDPQSTANDEAKDEALKREGFTILTVPPHPNIVQGFIVAKIKGNYHIFMELVSGGDLTSFLKECTRINKKLEWSELYPLIYQMAVGVWFLHSKGIIHKDLKPENILIKKIKPEVPHMMTHVLKIADFGLVSFREILESDSNDGIKPDLNPDGLNQSKDSSTLVTQNEKDKVGSGQFCDVRYAAPEQEGSIDFHKKLNKFTDIFSFGILIVELITNQLGFKDGSEFRKILSDFEPLDIPDNLVSANMEIQDEIDRYIDSHRKDTCEKIRNIVKKCLELYPSDRFQDISEIIRLLEEIDDLTIRINNEVEQKPSIPEILFWGLRGDSLKVLGFPNTSHESHRKALSLPITNVADRFNKGRSLQELEEHQKAIFEFDNIISMEKDYIDAYIHKAISCSALGNHLEAVYQYRLAELVNPNDPLIYYNKGNALRRLERHDDAISSYDRAIEIFPCYVDALYYRAKCLCIKEQFDKAQLSMDRAIECEPWDQSLHTFKNKILEELERNKKSDSNP